ncbi:MAG: class I SAM-dependent methyltransferase [Phycisphaerae bacterium]|nr:class I SAM-dependent methyltransferase [Phycisphaerae bacterium]
MNYRLLMRMVCDPRFGINRFDSYLFAREVAKQKKALDLETERQRSIRFLSHHFDCDAAAYLEEYKTSQFLKEYDETNAALLKQLGHLRATSSRFDCETLYLTVRAAKPQVVVETGVLYGAFSAHFLEALERNGGGQLICLDLPSPPGRPPQDALVPPRLRGRSKLVLGDTKDTLADVFKEAGSIDLFNHDSLHTFPHMMWEYLMAHRALKPGGVLTSHDVLAGRFHPNAFPTFTDALGYRHTIVRNYGIAIKPSDV